LGTVVSEFVPSMFCTLNGPAPTGWVAKFAPAALIAVGEPT